MKFSQWLKEQEAVYQLSIEEIPGHNQFMAHTWIISDPVAKGLTFSLSENDQGEACLLVLQELFTISWLNCAEGFSSDFIQGVALALLQGDLPVKYSPLMKIPYIEFIDENGKSARGTIDLGSYLFKQRSISERITLAMEGYQRLNP